MRKKAWFIARLCLLAILPCGAEPVPEKLALGLASEDFSRREAAQKELLEWAKSQKSGAASEVLKLSRNDDDPEVRMRSLEVLRELSDEDYLSDGQGFLGITMQEEMLEGGAGGNRAVGIRILYVVKDSAADNAGLEMGDVITSLDGKGWKEAGGLDLFRDEIARRKPLGEVKLTVKRADQDPREITVRLGKRPIADLSIAGGDLHLMDEKAKERHFGAWLKAQAKAEE